MHVSNKSPLGTSGNYVSFNIELNFHFKTPDLKWPLPYKCEMVHRTGVTQTDVDGVILPGLRPFVNSADVGSDPISIVIPYLNKKYPYCMLCLH